MPITFYPGERFAVFIDGANINFSKRNISMFVDDLRLLHFFRNNSGSSIFLRIYHYETVPRDDGSEDRASLITAIRKRLDFMEYNGFTIVSKLAKDFISETGEQTMKGNMDGEMIVDMMDISANLDHIVLFSGDGDFRYAVQKLQQCGKRVTVVSSEGSIANDLKRQTDVFVDLEELRPHIESETLAQRELA